MGIPALILAAGAGLRLGANGRPKVLAEIAGTPLLVRLLWQLIPLGVSPITVAIGAHAALVRETVEALQLPAAVEFVDNPDFASTNNAYTLHLCGSQLLRGGLLIEGDVAADSIVFEKVLASPAPSLWAVRSPGPILDGAFLTPDGRGVLRDLRIIRDGAERPTGGYKSTGILKLSPGTAEQLRGWLAQEIATRRDRYYDLVVADHLAEAALHLLVVDEGRWIEVDSPADLALAHQLFGAA
jgi:choline kinase